MLFTAFKVAVALVVFLAIFRLGFGLLRSFARPVPPPLPSGEMRRINVRYRCTVCGAEARMVLAPDEDPPPPRHCQDDMVLVAPIE